MEFSHTKFVKFAKMEVNNFEILFIDITFYF